LSTTYLFKYTIFQTQLIRLCIFSFPNKVT